MKTKITSKSELQNRPEPLGTASRKPINFIRRRANRSLRTNQLLALLRADAPNFFDLAEVVGSWVWIQFTDNPITGTTTTGAGRLNTVSVPIASTTGTVTYSYDELGRVTGRTIDGANPVNTTFDTLGRVTSVTNALTPPSESFTYMYVNQTSRLRTVTYPASTGLSTNYSYFDNTHPQDFERLQTIQNMSGATQLSKFDYTYNAVGTIATWAQQTSAPTGTYTLSYDNADQLTNAVQTLSGTTVASNAYNYDPAGNRLSETTLTGTTVGAFNNLNQLSGMTTGTLTTSTVSGYTSTPVGTVTVSDVTGHPVTATVTSGTNFSASVAMPPGTNIFSVVATPTGTSYPVTTQKLKTTLSGTMPTNLTYDANGNTLTDEHGNSYTWDALNRLTKISYSTGGYSTFVYDGLSRRIQIGDNLPSGTTTKNYLWIGSEIAEERDASNTVTKRFFPQGEQQTISGTTTAYYYTRDQVASVREMMDGSGTIVSRLSYDVYGKTTVVSGTNLPFYQYAGLVKHIVSGLDLGTYRLYENGRWLSRDPLDEEGGTNLYDYVTNNPLSYNDPRGLKCEKCGIKRGPEYNVSGTVPSGTVLSFTAEFLNDETHDPSCCEVRQLIKWNKAPFPGAPQGPAPHGGFKPPRNQPGEWYEDRDDANTRYGRRKGAPYADTDPGNGYSGNGYHGADQPGGSNPIPIPGLTYSFRLIVVDICNGGALKYTSKTVTVDRGQVPAP